MTKRAHLTGKERLRLFTLCGGICQFCRGEINPACEAWEVSHDIPLELGGADDDLNRKVAHKKCHRAHTAAVDLPNIAKARRRELKNMGARPKSRAWQSSKFRRKVDGSVVAR